MEKDALTVSRSLSEAEYRVVKVLLGSAHALRADQISTMVKKQAEKEPEEPTRQEQDVPNYKRVLRILERLYSDKIVSRREMARSRHVYFVTCGGVQVKPIGSVAVDENEEHELIYNTLYQCPKCKGISIRD